MKTDIIQPSYIAVVVGMEIKLEILQHPGMLLPENTDKLTSPECQVLLLYRPHVEGVQGEC